MKWIKFVLPILILSVGFLAKIGLEASASEAEDDKPIDTRPKVTVEQLYTQNHTVALSSYGEITPLESTNLAAQVSGEVIAWNPKFVTGGIVERDEVLFVIEKDAYEAALLQAEAALANARSTLIQEQAQADVAAREARSMPKAKVTDLYLRKPQVLSAQAALKSAQAQLRIAQRDLANCEVKAPYDALIISRSIGKGDFVSTGTVAAVLNNIETAEMMFPVAGFDRAFIASDMIGMTADIVLDNQSKTVIQGVIHRDSGVVDQATRMTHFIARIDDPYSLHSDKPVAKFGTYATIHFQGKTLDDVFRVPQKLINQNKLWTLNEKDELVSNDVNIVREQDSDFLIKGNFDSRKVVTTLPEYPQEGMSVKVISETNELAAKRPTQG